MSGTAGTLYLIFEGVLGLAVIAGFGFVGVNSGLKRRKRRKRRKRLARIPVTFA